MSTVIYLHGLASSPKSIKGRFFARLFEKLSISVVMPDLNLPRFESLTISRALSLALRLIDETDPDEPLMLMGSSFGGLVAALAAAQRPQRLRAICLMAPAFDMEGLWTRTLGAQGVEEWKRNTTIPVEHPAYDHVQKLGIGFYRDAMERGTAPIAVAVPALVFQGRNDSVVEPEMAQRFGELNARAEVHMLADGHELLDSQTVMAQALEVFLHRVKMVG
jgi:hypothetical protein